MAEPDLLTRLADVANLKLGDREPEWAHIGGWSKAISKMAKEAQQGILMLRTRKAVLEQEISRLRATAGES